MFRSLYFNPIFETISNLKNTKSKNKRNFSWKIILLYFKFIHSLSRMFKLNFKKLIPTSAVSAFLHYLLRLDLLSSFQLSEKMYFYKILLFSLQKVWSWFLLKFIKMFNFFSKKLNDVFQLCFSLLPFS